MVSILLGFSSLSYLVGFDYNTEDTIGAIWDLARSSFYAYVLGMVVSFVGRKRTRIALKTILYLGAFLLFLLSYVSWVCFGYMVVSQVLALVLKLVGVSMWFFFKTLVYPFISDVILLSAALLAVLCLLELCSGKIYSFVHRSPLTVKFLYWFALVWIGLGFIRIFF